MAGTLKKFRDMWVRFMFIWVVNDVCPTGLVFGEVA